MTYRVLRYFVDDPSDQTLIGHYDTKRLADDAIRDDQYKRKRNDLKYSVEAVEIELNQEQIDEMLRQSRGNQNGSRTKDR